MHKFYSDKWADEQAQMKLRNRTPLQIERDRILYSFPLRRQTDKYHILYSGPKKVVRNYTTHTMRMAHVTRAICRALNLNFDFGEAIALGSKVGATPFIHAAKKPVAKWINVRLADIDRLAPNRDEIQTKLFGAEALEDAEYPNWLTQIQSPSVRDEVFKYIPWARGIGTDIHSAYGSGKESYWLLTTNCFTRESKSCSFSPETMYGIWRHSRKNEPGKENFQHRCIIDGTAGEYHEITWRHVTYEAAVVRYADDITWIIENLNDANTATALSDRRNLYQELKIQMRRVGSLPFTLHLALDDQDAGALYTYFIEDFIRNSEPLLDALEGGGKGRLELLAGDKNSFIGLSEEESDI